MLCLTSYKAIAYIANRFTQVDGENIPGRKCSQTTFCCCSCLQPYMVFTKRQGSFFCSIPSLQGECAKLLPVIYFLLLQSSRSIGMRGTSSAFPFTSTAHLNRGLFSTLLCRTPSFSLTGESKQRQEAVVWRPREPKEGRRVGA